VFEAKLKVDSDPDGWKEFEPLPYMDYKLFDEKFGK
jgi:hypothetical protein